MRIVAGVGGGLAAVSLGALPFVADAAVPATGCPDGLTEAFAFDYDPPTPTVDVPNIGAIAYIVVDTANGRFLIGDGSPLNNTTVDVLAETGAPASRAGLCKDESGTTTTTSTTSTTVPDTTTTTSTTSTTTSTTVPDTTTTTTSTTTSTTVPDTTTTTSTTTTSTVPDSTTTTVLTSPPTTAPPSTPPSTPATTIEIGILPPAAPPAVDPRVAPAPTPISPPVTELPVTGRSSADTMLVGLAALGLGMLMVGISRRTA
jgi:hypothetical protein